MLEALAADDSIYYSTEANVVSTFGKSTVLTKLNKDIASSVAAIFKVSCAPEGSSTLGLVFKL